jgi:carbon-monoxide dehydrogenase large subunit
VKWIEDRSEHFVATNHAREQVCDIEIAGSSDGRLLGFRARCLINQGAYARTHGGVLLPQLVIHHLAGPYRWMGFAAEATSVLTNKTPAGTYRGPAQYEPTFFRERMLDRLAAELGFDPVELRRHNLVPAAEMPYRIELGEQLAPIIYDSGDYPVTLERLVADTGYDELLASLEARRRGGETVGAGVAAYIEEGGFGPWEHATLVPGPDGRFTAHVGISALGQGVRTALAQIAADALGVGLDRVEISHRDTDLVREGFGAYASRTTILGGSAIVMAVADLERRAREVAAETLSIAPDDVTVDFAESSCTGPDGGAVPLAELGCVGEGRYEKSVSGFSMGVCLAVVAVDPETASAAVERIVICHDVGRVVNPAIVHGQIAGAAVQGAAGALLESLPYDEEGQPLATSFMDYLMPTAAEAPNVETIVLELDHHSPESANPLGVKGCGESGIIGSGAAVANAIAAARGADGREVRSLPVRLDRLS